MKTTHTNKTIAYCKPTIFVVCSIVETIGGTHVKGHAGVIEAIQRRILPAYDLDE